MIDKYMEEDTAAIWVKVGVTRRDTVTIGGIYREHTQLGNETVAATWMEYQQ